MFSKFMRAWRRALQLAWLAGAGACAGAALEVTPVIHELPAAQKALSMAVSNHGGQSATLQVRAFTWSQDENGQEQLTPMPEIVLSPAIFTVEGGRTQRVRAIFPGDGGERERSYRILIDELPDVSGAEPVRFALRLSVPVFRQTAVPVPAALSWRLEAGSRKLLAVNRGGRRERIRELSLASAKGERTQPTSPWGLYLLAGNSRSWAVDPRAGELKPGDPWTLTAQTDAGPIEIPLVVAP
jgi:fimbrial chaperone protein